MVTFSYFLQDFQFQRYKKIYFQRIKPPCLSLKFLDNPNGELISCFSPSLIISSLKKQDKIVHPYLRGLARTHFYFSQLIMIYHLFYKIDLNVPAILVQLYLWRCGVVVIITAKLHSTKPGIRLSRGSNPVLSMSEIRDGENLIMTLAENKAKYFSSVNHQWRILKFFGHTVFSMLRIGQISDTQNSPMAVADGPKIFDVQCIWGRIIVSLKKIFVFKYSQTISHLDLR